MMGRCGSVGFARSWMRALFAVDAGVSSRGVWRIGVLVSACVAVVFGCLVVAIGVRDTLGATAGVVQRAAVVASWLSAGVAAWWWAGNQAALDRDRGIAQLLAVHGVSVGQLGVVGWVVTSWRIAWLLMIATLPVAVAAWVTSMAVGAGMWRGLQVLSFAAYCMVAGMVLGGMSYGCARWTNRWGRLWFVALVLIPWAVQEVLIPTEAGVGSVPSLLGALAKGASRFGGAL